jgi:hypothetical protein
VRASLMVMDRNPEAVEKTLMNKSWVAQALLPVSKAVASHTSDTGKSACATEARTGHGLDAVTEMLPAFVGPIYTNQLMSHPRMCSGSADPRLWGPRFFRSKNHKSHEEESALGLGGVGSAELCAFQHYSAVLNMATSTMILTSKNKIPWMDEEPQTNAKNAYVCATRLCHGRPKL